MRLGAEETQGQRGEQFVLIEPRFEPEQLVRTRVLLPCEMRGHCTLGKLEGAELIVASQKAATPQRLPLFRLQASSADPRNKQLIGQLGRPGMFVAFGLKLLPNSEQSLGAVGSLQWA